MKRHYNNRVRLVWHRVEVPLFDIHYQECKDWCWKHHGGKFYHNRNGFWFERSMDAKAFDDMLSKKLMWSLLKS